MEAERQSSNRQKIENEDNKTSFMIQKVTRADIGVYTVIAKNDSGTDLDLEIEVVSKFLFFFSILQK